MSFNFQKIKDLPINIVKSCNPDPSKAGNFLLVINALGMVLAAITNTFAAAVDKHTSAEDKKFLIPAGLATGVANIGLYYAMTDRIIEGLKKSVDKSIAKMKPEDVAKKALALVDKKIAKEKNLTIAESMKQVLKNEDGSITEAAIQLYKDNSKAAAGVLGAFTGAVVGCAILTPIIRDVSAYFVQKQMEKRNPNLKEKPYQPYFEPTRLASAHFQNNKQPLSMKNYMAFTNSGNLKI